MNDKAIITCAITGVLTDPGQHPVPVSPGQLAREARRACDAGATVVHVHFRQQAPGKGHLPSWEPQVALDCVQAMRAACPGLIINQSTGVIGPHCQGPIACLRATRPEMAACNAGSLNYLKVRNDGSWAWPPMLFDNPPAKVKDFIDVMAETGTLPEFECFDLGIVRCVQMYVQTGIYTRGLPAYNFVMGVESGMPADPDLLPILLRLAIAGAPWQATVIGRAEVWPVHQRVAELGGHLRSGLEDLFYLPDGTRVDSNGPLIEQLARCARNAGREVATAQEARALLGLPGA
ncbi:BKACE family enzyme [Verminephrobacter eiseniae]|uniref:3-keto-5-aminohexanoate cleavage protein n=1 Tax=Verminephrobacter eiseniae TaxID=364317 RepID=UPI002237F7F6|nr:3-keto-5-aminohexanoate cleavage protein [Verminephrobacter eiseniae]MCW5236475.1 3-keto-5-aminohexanoate cleavage protein [Verminephrobacter eiseniae]